MQARIPRIHLTDGLRLSDAFADARFFYNAAVNADISRFTLPSSASGVTRAVGSAGKVAQIATSGASANFLEWATSTRYDPPSTGFTMFFYGQRLAASGANYDRVFTRDVSEAQGAGNRFGFLLTPPADPTAPNRVYFYSENGTTGTNTGQVGGNTISPTDRFALYLLSHNGSTARLYFDGRLQDSAASSVPAASSRVMRIGSATYTTTQIGAPFKVAFAGMLPRPMSAAEAQKFGANPWGAFQPRRIWVPVSAGGGVVISATPGDAVASGPLAQINQARLIAGTPGNAAADGVVAKIDQARRIDATPGNAAADGVTAQINQARLIAAGPGNAVADGVTAKIDQARRIDATAGNAVAAGVNAQIITAGAVVIDCTPGAAVADGVLAQINQAQIVLATAGAAVAAGVDALISTADDVVINATPGNAFAQGAQAIIVRDVLVLATPGAAVAAGVNASITTASLNDDLYPLAGMTQDYPLMGMSQTYPLQGQTPS